VCGHVTPPICCRCVLRVCAWYMRKGGQGWQMVPGGVMDGMAWGGLCVWMVYNAPKVIHALGVMPSMCLCAVWMVCVYAAKVYSHCVGCAAACVRGGGVLCAG
jgi:hypothetical protein